jgi:hypothetical protein
LNTTDPYERHARRFLARLQHVSRTLTEPGGDVQVLIGSLDKLWGQVLAAFRWASLSGSNSTAAADIATAIMDCADGNIVAMQGTRAAAEVQALADYLSALVRRQDNANDMAVMIRFAGIAKVQAGILGLAEQTGADVRNLLASAMELFQTRPAEIFSGLVTAPTADRRRVQDKAEP